MLPNVAVHLVQRGNNRAACFHDEEDRAFYLFHLERIVARARCAIHAYCLMTNHVHLLATPHDGGGCAQVMKGIGQLHSQYMNKKYKRSGSLWEGRYKSCLVQSENYLLACYRYIELNPLRAGLVRRPDEFLWSSYRANALGAAARIVVPHAEYVRLGRCPEERQTSYRELCAAGLGEESLEEIRSVTNAGYALGDAIFKRTMARLTGRRVEKGRPGRPAAQNDKRQAVCQTTLLTDPENGVCP